MALPESVEKLIQQFSKLPGIGSKTAERFVFYLLKQPKQNISEFINSLEQLKNNVQICSECFDYSEKSPCRICSDPGRDKTTVCIVAESPDILAMEKAGEFEGVYFVLGGTINEIQGIGLEQLNYHKLETNIKRDHIKEIILALDANIQGETTAMYLAKKLKPLDIKVTRLARGLPMGSDIEYADEITLSNALKGRREI